MINLQKIMGAKDLNDLNQLVTKQIQNQYKMSLDAFIKRSSIKSNRKNA